MRGKIYDITVWLHDFFFDDADTIKTYLGVVALGIIVVALLMVMVR